MTRQSFIAIVAAVCFILPVFALVGCSHSVAPPPPQAAATTVPPPPATSDREATAEYQKAVGMAADRAAMAKAAAAAAPKQ